MAILVHDPFNDYDFDKMKFHELQKLDDIKWRAFVYDAMSYEDLTDLLDTVEYYKIRVQRGASYCGVSPIKIYWEIRDVLNAKKKGLDVTEYLTSYHF